MNDNTMLEEKQLQGFGGWFVLVLIGLFATTILSIIDFIQYFEIWQYVDFGLGCLYTVDYLNSIILSIVILIFVFRKNILFRKLFLIQTCAYALWNIIFLFISGGYKAVTIILMLVERALWTLYLYRSERVKNTFIDDKQTEENKDLAAI